MMMKGHQGDDNMKLTPPLFFPQLYMCCLKLAGLWSQAATSRQVH